ncbi:hypothetical protein SDC9_172439 [bioreactor metagenome]|uniref:Uncharacterized protein n=1 Tax=bioreactor metagenome TaxID=1076179 RepID=A0A645GG52_9ZZZZ
MVSGGFAILGDPGTPVVLRQAAHPASEGEPIWAAIEEAIKRVAISSIAELRVADPHSSGGCAHVEGVAASQSGCIGHVANRLSIVSAGGLEPGTLRQVLGVEIPVSDQSVLVRLRDGNRGCCCRRHLG